MTAPFVVNRSNPSSRYWSYQTSDVTINSNLQPDKRVRIVFEINSKGGGVTEIAVCPNADGISQLVERMIVINPDVATSVLKSAVISGGADVVAALFCQVLQISPDVAMREWSKAVIEWLDGEDPAESAP